MKGAVYESLADVPDDAWPEGGFISIIAAANEVKKLKEERKELHEMIAAGAKRLASDNALDAIAIACGCSEWEYPNQVVRDVESLARRLEKAEAEAEAASRLRAEADRSTLALGAALRRARRAEVVVKLARPMLRMHVLLAAARGALAAAFADYDGRLRGEP